MKTSIDYRIVPLLCSVLTIISGIAGCTKSEKKAQDMPSEIIYIGTFDGDGSEGLYVFEFNPVTGEMNQIQTVSNRKGPNFQAIDPTGHYLYSVSGEPFADSSKAGTVSAYSIDQQNGKLTLINEQSIEGRGPAHVSVDPKGRFVYVSNYGSGSLSVFAIRDDGGLSAAVEVVQHEGHSINKKRQQSPHVHSIIPSPDGSIIYVSDLGMDKIMIYKVDAVTGKLSPAPAPYFKSTPGAGPRHFIIHPGEQFAYSAEEMSSTVAVLKVNEATGGLTQIQRISTIPKSYEDKNTAADIHISPDGQFLYASNRGHNSLVIYKINQSSGKLTLVGYQSTRGERPRNFMVGQQGDFVWVANLNSDKVVLFERNKATGKLSYTGTQVKVPQPVCVSQFTLD